MGLEKLGMSCAQRFYAWTKAGNIGVIPARTISIPRTETLKYAPKLAEDTVQFSFQSNPIGAIYNFKERFGQFMADYRCAFMAKHEFRAFEHKDQLNPDYLLRDMQRYKNVGQKSTSRIEEILVSLSKGGLNSTEKETLMKEFEALCENTLVQKTEFQGLKTKLKHMYSDYSTSLNNTQTKSRLKPARDIENPAELVRVPDNIGERLPKAYVENSKDVRHHFNKAIDDGSYLNSYESYVDTMNNAHKLAYSGKNGNSFYYKKNGQTYVMDAGNWRQVDIDHRRDTSGYYFGRESVESIAKRYNDPLANVLKTGDVAKTSRVNLKGIPEKYQPVDKWDCIDFEGFKYSEYIGHSYPPVESLQMYHKEMYRTAKETLNRIKNGESENRILESLAEHFQYAANARAYNQINNSLYMNEINTLLQRAGMRVMPHGNLDVVAQRLQPETFKQYFIDTYNKTALPNLNVDKYMFATMCC